MWGVNFDDVCRSIMREKRFGWIIDISDYIIIETGTGHVIKSPNFKHRVAMQLNQVASLYIGNNAKKCKYWVQFIQETHGPTGPSEE